MWNKIIEGDLVPELPTGSVFLLLSYSTGRITIVQDVQELIIEVGCTGYDDLATLIVPDPYR